MSKGMKRVAVVSAIVLGVGLIIAFTGFMLGGYRPLYIGSEGIHYYSGDEAAEYESVDETYVSVSSIRVDTDEMQVVLEPGAGYTVKGKNPKLNGGLRAELADGLLTVSSKNQKSSWFNVGYIFPADDVKVVITYPKGARFAEVDVKSDTGRITAKGLSADSLTLNNDTGPVFLEDAQAGALKASSDTGRVEMKRVAADSADIGVGTGSLHLSGFASNGLVAQNNTGSIDIEGTLHGKSQIKNDTGRISIKLSQPLSSFSYYLYADTGSVRVNGNKVGKGAGPWQGGSTGDSISAVTDTGSVRLDCPE